MRSLTPATSASARTGEPVPSTNFSGAAISTRALRRQLVEMAEAREAVAIGLVHQRMRGEGGFMPPAEPASVPTVSEPQPITPFEIRYLIASAVGPGECGRSRRR